MSFNGHLFVPKPAGNINADYADLFATTSMHIGISPV